MSLRRHDRKRKAGKQHRSSFLGAALFSGRRWGESRRGLRIEPLEERRLLTVDMVTSNLDDGSAGTLRSVVAAAASGDTIEFNSGISQIDLTQGQIEINKNLTIQGPGAGSLTIDQTTSGGARIFQIDATDTDNNPVTVSMSGLTLSRGDVTSPSLVFPNNAGGAIYNAANLSLDSMTLSANKAGFGGGVFNAAGATLTVGDSTFTGDSASSGGGIHNRGIASVNDSTVSGNSATNRGAGIYSQQALTVTASTVADNSAPGSTEGGGIWTVGTTTITDDTIAENSAYNGGGIWNNGATTIVDSTISANTSVIDAGGDVESSDAGANVANTIIAGNFITGGGADPDVNGSYAATDHDLIGVVGNAFGFTDGSGNAINGNQVGTATSPLDPRLGPLQDDGGLTETMALLPDSPAIDKGDNSPPSPFPATPATDQRGYTRIVNGTGDMAGAGQIDIGADEVQLTLYVAQTLYARTTTSIGTPTSSPTVGEKVLWPTASPRTGALTFGTNAFTTVSAAIAAAAPGDAIDVAAGTYREALDITEPLTLEGDDSPGVTTIIEGSGSGTGVTIATGTNSSTVLQGFTISGFAVGVSLTSGSRATLRSDTVTGNHSSTSDGGGIGNQGTLSLVQTTVNDNSASDGGGVFSMGTLSVSNSTLSGNSAGEGGGIFAGGALSVIDSTVSGNSATTSDGGGVFDDGGNAAITNSTLADNSAAGDGGGLFATNGGTFTLAEATVSGNSALVGGGIANNGGTVNLANTLVAGNHVSGTGSSDPDVSGNFADTDHNLIGLVGDASGFTSGNLVGTTTALDPLLGPLANNGGPTETIVPLPRSPAIDAGDNSPQWPFAAPTTDQRGDTRIVNSTIDIGAVEVQPTLYVANSFYDQTTGQPTATPVTGDTVNWLGGGQFAEVDDLTFGTNAFTSVQAAVAAAPPYATVEIAAGSYSESVSVTQPLVLVGTDTGAATIIEAPIAHSGTGIDISNTAGTVTVQNITVTDFSQGVDIANGSNAQLDDDVISNNQYGQGGSGIGVWNRGTLTISGSTISDNSGNGFGGGIENQGTLSLTSSSVVGNSVIGNGGGIYNFGTAGVIGSTIARNLAGAGGAGMINFGTLTVVDSTVSGNAPRTATSLGGGGIFGGAFDTTAVLTLIDSSVTDNVSTDGAGGLFIQSSFPIFATIVGSTISGNTATSGDGGGMTLVRTAATIVDSTIANNSAAGSGGGIYLLAGGSSRISGSTISGNSANTGGGIFEQTEVVNGTSVSPTSNVANTIIAGNTVTGTDPDVSGSFAAADHDLIGNVGDAAGFTNGSGNAINGNQVGTAASPLDPKLGPLEDNGGLTETMALLPGSPAIDNGDNAPSSPFPPTPATDQRGLPRLTDGAIDIGAVQHQVDLVTDAGDDTTGATLRNVIAAANPGDVVEFSLPSGTTQVGLTQGQIEINKTLTIQGPGAGSLAIDQTTSGGARVFQVDAMDANNKPISVSMSGLTLTGGTASGSIPDGYGGGIYNLGSLSLHAVTVSDSTADYGGGIANLSTLTLAESTLSKNTATQQAGGLYNLGTVTVTDCTVSGNSATQGGGIGNFNTATVTDTTISGNSANIGGGILEAASVSVSAPTTNVANTIIAGNSVSGSGASDPDVAGAFTSTDHDLVGVLVDAAGALDATGFTEVTGDAANGNLVGTAASPINPLLAPLGNYSGQTQTMPPLANSLALNAGDPSPAAPFATPAIDQRGLPRLTNGQIDIGAAEHDDVATSGADDGAAGTLRTVIAAAAPGDTITFASGLSQIDLTRGQIEIDKNLTIQGPGAGSLTIDQTTSGDAARLFQIDATDGAGNAISVSMSGLTLTGGNVTNFFLLFPANHGGAINNAGSLSLDAMTLSGNQAAGGGGALANFGTLTVADSTLSNNSVAGASGDGGGAIYNAGNATITDTTISDNSANVNGGGIENLGTITITGSTLAGNSDTQDGGGLENGGPATVTDSTFSGNTSGLYGGAVSNFSKLVMTGSTISGNSAGSGGSGGGIFSWYLATSEIANSVIAGNTSSYSGGELPDDVAGSFAVTDHDLVGVVEATGSFAATGFTDGSGNAVNGNLLGTATDPLDPKLAPLGNYGGPTATMFPLPGSPLLNAGDPSPASPFATPAIDERGDPRLTNGAIDIGAFEHSDVVTSGADDGSPGTLRFVLAEAAPGETITFQSGLQQISLTQGQIEIDKNLTIQGPGAGSLTIGQTTSGDAARLFQIDATDGAGKAISVSMSGLTLTGGNLTNLLLFPANDGGAINNAGSLSLDAMTLSGNQAAGGGGALANFGTLTLADSTLSNNSVAKTFWDGGGGIYNAGNATITDTTISDNSGKLYGGGIENIGTITITGSTLAGNSDTQDGGGLENRGPATVTDSTFSGNTSGVDGGAVDNFSKLVMTGSTISGNSVGSGGLLGSGGGIFSANVATSEIANSVIAGNTSSYSGGELPDDVAGTFSSTDHDLIGIVGNAAGFTSNGDPINGNLVGTATALDPMLAPLANYGGPTQTMALLPGSPALNAGDAAPTSYTLPSTDQRGLPRLTNGAIDIGATQHQVDLVTDAGDDPSDTSATLRNVIATANAGDIIEFALPSDTTQIDLTQGQIEIDKDLTIQGPGAGALTVEQTIRDRLFQIDANDASNNPVSVSMTGLTLTGGIGPGGGAINNSGRMTVSNCVMTGNQCDQYGGGAIFNDGRMTVVDTTISGNSDDGGFGGAIDNQSGSLTLQDSTVSGNEEIPGFGGGIYNGDDPNSLLVVIDSTISGNSAPSGTSYEGGGGITNLAQLFLINATISGNSAFGPGGGIENSGEGQMYVADSTVSGNSSAAIGGGIDSSTDGSAYIVNTIVAGNHGGDHDPDVSGSFLTHGVDVGPEDNPNGMSESDLIGIVGDASGFVTSGPDACMLGTAQYPINAQLGPLADNGGPTQTMALLPGSPAIDAGMNSLPVGDGVSLPAMPATDQRGLPRIVNGTVDIGAFELSRVTASMSGDYTVKLMPSTSTEPAQTEILDPNGNVVFTSPVSLMPSLIFANTGGYTVNLTVDYSAGDPLPAGGLTYDGGGNDGLTVTGYNTSTLTDSCTGAHSGSVQVGSGGAISYSGLSPLALSGTANEMIINLPSGAVTATLQDDGTPGNSTSQLVSTNGAFEATTFSDPSGSLTVNAGSDGDTITVARSFATDFNADLSLIGGAGDDTFNVYGTPVNGSLSVNGGGSVNGNVLNDFTASDAEVWSDAGTPPVVSIASSGQTPLTYTSIEQVNVTPGNGVVNVYGDNNQPATSQNDGYQIVGTGPNAFTLAISGNNTNQASYSMPINVTGVHTLNVDGESKGTKNGHNDTNTLAITPFADNTPQGWGVQTFWNRGNANGGGTLVYNGVAGVSENIAVVPSAAGAGQLESANSATSTPVAVVNYSLNTNIVVNGNDGSAGDTDTLTLKGTNPGAAESQQFAADFATPGSTGPNLRVSDVANGNTLYTLHGFSNISTLNVLGAGAPSQNTLLIDGYDPANGQSGQLDASLTVGEDRSSSTAGVVSVFQSQPPGTQYPEINYSGIGTLNVNSASNSSVQGPSIAFGSPNVAGSGLEGASDTGVAGQPATLDDLITADSTPTFYGTAQAGALVQLYVDMNGNGKVDNGDVFMGETTATAAGGQLNGQWTISSTVDLNNPKFGFAHDGLRTILATAEDAAGDVSSPQSLTILLDTQGPQIGSVSVTGQPSYNMFLNEEPTPTPLVQSLDVTFTDPVTRSGGFVFPAVNQALATTAANYQLVGRNNGVIPISSVTFADNTTAGGPGTSVATLHFATPLPDDYYTLTINDAILDNAGNALSGTFNGSFPTGNGSLGSAFTGSFVVNSHPHLAVASNGSISLDINGDGSFNPSNTVPDSDFTESFGLPNDRLVSGNFASSSGTVSGFDELGAYGSLNGQWRWLLNLNPAQGTSDATSFVEPLSIDGQPVAGYFAGNRSLGMQVGLFSKGTWYLDVLNHHTVDAGDVAAGGKLKGDMRGTPIVGDFDGDGKTDLATYQNGVFEFDLSSKDPGGKLTGNFNATLNAQALIPALASATTAAPLVADLDGDGISDLGLFVTASSTATTTSGQWYWLVSDDAKDAGGVDPAGAFASLSHAFNPAPLGHDQSYQFGDSTGTPLMGTWDPPTSATASNGTPATGFIPALYETVLGRPASPVDLAGWNGALASGQTTEPQAAQSFVDSSERLGTIINGYYQQYLGRAADQAGLNYWIGIWQASGGSEQVQAGIIGSPEYFAAAGRLYPNLSPAAAWVTALYNNLLGRAPDAPGLSYWVNYIQTHSLASVVIDFVTSDEYRFDLVNGFYEQYLGRAVDAGSATYWLAQMQHGVTQNQIVTAILSSVEFINRSQAGR